MANIIDITSDDEDLALKSIGQKRRATITGKTLKAKQVKLDFQQVIEVVADGATFHVPSNLLKSRSSLAAKHQDNGPLHVSWSRAETFSTYLQLLYTDQIILSAADQKVSDKIRAARLVSLYILAEKMGDPVSMNLVIEELVDALNHDFCARALVAVIYRHCCKESKLRKLVVDYGARQWTIDHDAVPDEYRRDLVDRFFQARAELAQDNRETMIPITLDKYMV